MLLVLRQRGGGRGNCTLGFSQGCAITPPPLCESNTGGIYKGQCRTCFQNHLKERLLDQAQARASYTCGALATAQSAPMPIYGPLFASAECPRAHIWRHFYQCKVSPGMNMDSFLLVQSVPMPIYGGHFSSAKVSSCLCMGAFLPVQRVPGHKYESLLLVQSVPML